MLELGQIMAGPVCGMMLADLGADVIKVEKLPGGDDARAYREPRINGVSVPFLMLNRNKRSIAIDLQRQAGRGVLLRLASNADVLIENFRPGTLERLGVGYDELARRNPRLIYCAISGYGRSGPMAGAGGFDLVAQGYAGLMGITGEPGGPPLRFGSSTCDINAGILAALGILAAIQQRKRTGRGQSVETSLLEAGLQQLYWHAAVWFATNETPGATGSAHVLIAPYEAFPTRDHWIVIGGANERNWERIATVLGRPEWLEDPRFRSNEDRLRNVQKLRSEMRSILAEKPAMVWLSLLGAAGVPCGPIHSVAEALESPQALAMQMNVVQNHPVAGPVRSIGSPVKLSDSPAPPTRHAPSLGEHTLSVLLDLGFDPEEVAALSREGAIYVGPPDSGASAST